VKQSKLVVVALAVLVLVGVGVAVAYLVRENFALKVEIGTLRYQLEVAAKARPPARVADPADKGPAARTVGNLTRQVMLDELSSETGSEKKLWIRVNPRDREAATFARQIADVFREAKWEVFLLDPENLRFKPGLLMMVGADDSPPSYVETAQRAFQALSDPIVVRTGYLSYYEKMKEKTPDWRGGIPFLPGQTYVVFVGSKPEPTPDG
jgi:hypothetical protein